MVDGGRHSSDSAVECLWCATHGWAWWLEWNGYHVDSGSFLIHLSWSSLLVRTLQESKCPGMIQLPGLAGLGKMFDVLLRISVDDSTFL
jgi:hypothetical protein